MSLIIRSILFMLNQLEDYTHFLRMLFLILLITLVDGCIERYQFYDLCDGIKCDSVNEVCIRSVGNVGCFKKILYGKDVISLHISKHGRRNWLIKNAYSIQRFSGRRWNEEHIIHPVANVMVRWLSSEAGNVFLVKTLRGIRLIRLLGFDKNSEISQK